MFSRKQLQYKGSMRAQPGTFSYATGLIEFDFARNEIIMATGNAVGRLSLVPPAMVVDGNPGSYPVMPLAGDFVDYTNGDWSINDTGGRDGVGLGNIHLIAPDRLGICATTYYDANGSQRRSWASAEYPKTSGPVERTPWRSIGAPTMQGYVAGPSCSIPLHLQDIFGGDMLSGQPGGLPIISRQSVGPCAIAFKSGDLLTEQQLQEKMLVGYTLASPIPGYPHGGPPNEVFNSCTRMRVVKILGTDIVWFGTHGLGESCYGEGWNGIGEIPPNSCYDPTASSKGYHCYPYRTQIWQYPIEDLKRVALGEISPSSLVPTVEDWEGLWPTYGHPHYGNVSDKPAGTSPIGVGVNERTREFYVAVFSQDGQGWEPGPLIHVYDIVDESGHTDAPHFDAPHTDTPHDDVPAHTDVPSHTDVHSDAPHVDAPHDDAPHVDVHSDAPHDDAPTHDDATPPGNCSECEEALASAQQEIVTLKISLSNEKQAHQQTQSTLAITQQKMAEIHTEASAILVRDAASKPNQKLPKWCTDAVKRILELSTAAMKRR